MKEQPQLYDNSLTVNQPQKDKVRANIFKNMLAMAGK